MSWAVYSIVCEVCMSDLPSSLNFSVQCPLSFSLRLDLQNLKWYSSSYNLLLQSVYTYVFHFAVLTYHTLPCSHLDYCMHEAAEQTKIETAISQTVTRDVNTPHICRIHLHQVMTHAFGSPAT